MDQKYYVYIYSDPSRNNETFYVGKGHERRSRRHLTRTDHHPMTYRLRAMKRKGIEPVIQETALVEERIALAVEAKWIEAIGRKDLGTGPLLNQMEGGSQPPTLYGEKNGFFGRKHTDETKAKIAAKKKGKDWNISPEAKEEWKKKMAVIVKTPEYLAKLSAAKKGKPKSAEHRKKMSEARQRYLERKRNETL